MKLNSIISTRGLYSLYTATVLFVLLLFHGLWFVGTTTLQDYERLRKEYGQIQDEKARISAAAGSNGANASSSAASLIAPLDKKVDQLIPEMASAVGAIKTWNITWHWLLKRLRDSNTVKGSEIAEDAEDAEDAKDAKDADELRSANRATQILGLYILPLLYGWIGALLWVVQKLRADDSDPAKQKLHPFSRVVTGMVAGPMIGMFLSPEIFNSLATLATPFLIAFIGGYSTDVFFALIDRALHGIRDLLEKDSKAKNTVSAGDEGKSTLSASPPSSSGGG